MPIIFRCNGFLFYLYVRMYSQDFRQSVVSALDKGLSIRKVAALFGISKSTVQEWKKCPKPKENNAGRSPKIDAQALIKDVEMYSDAYQQERAERFNCSRSAIGECLKRLKISKQTAQHSRACLVKRSHFGLPLQKYKEQRRPDVFYAWVKNGLIPELPDKSVIVMDNATFHKRADIIKILQKAGHDILWLPPYSPDLNLIEAVWAWVKSARKRWKIDCIEKLFFYQPPTQRQRSLFFATAHLPKPA